MRRLRRGADIDRVDVGDLEQLAIIGVGGSRACRPAHLGEPLGARLGDVQALDQRVMASVSARMPPHQPVPTTATSTFLKPGLP